MSAPRSQSPVGLRHADEGGAGGAPGRGAGVGSVRAPLRVGEKLVEVFLFLAAASSVAITLGIVGVLVFESVSFFRSVSLWEFVSTRDWSPDFQPPRYGILPLVSGTLMTTFIALCVAVPVGTVVALWLSEYASSRVREWIKPVLELLSAIPTVVFGYFALLVVTPVLQRLFGLVGLELPGFNMLSAGLVMGLMIVPYVASLSEDAMRAVPTSLREGSFAMGATKFHTSWRVVFPAAFSGITAAYILAISRALGETMIVAVAAGLQSQFTLNPMDQSATLTAYIVRISGGDVEHESLIYRSIFAAGLTLVLMTLLFNVAGYILRRKFKEAY